MCVRYDFKYMVGYIYYVFYIWICNIEYSNIVELWDVFYVGLLGIGFIIN